MGDTTTVVMETSQVMTLRVEQSDKVKPESCCDFMVELQGVGIGEVIGKTGDQNRKGSPAKIVKATKVLCPIQVEAEFFQSLPLCSLSRVFLFGIEAPAGKGDIT